jgi:hypothetical protein
VALAGGLRVPPLKDLLADVLIPAMVVFCGWQLWSGFRRGVVLANPFPMHRDKSPIGFWLMMAIYAVFFALLGVATITYAIQVVEGHQPL